MTTTNITRIMAAKGLEHKAVAMLMFPDNKFPDAALRRLLRGKATLSMTQVEKFATYAGVSLEDVSSSKEWDGGPSGPTIILPRGDFKAVVDLKEGLTRVYHRESAFFKVIKHPATTPLYAYLKSINDVISKFQKNQKLCM